MATSAGPAEEQHPGADSQAAPRPGWDSTPYYTGRVIVVIIAIYLLTFGRRMLRPNVILPLAAAFTIVVGPMFAVNGWYVIHAMLGQSAIEYSSTIVGSRTTRFETTSY